MRYTTHTLGFPRIGIHRELKTALEAYWAEKITQAELINVGKALRLRHWQWQQESGIDLIPVGDFAWYDHILATSLMVGNVPARHAELQGEINLDTLFRIARGKAPTGQAVPAAEMSKWFNTNYHYLVPEFHAGQDFHLGWTQLFDELDEALAAGYQAKPVLLGPLSYLWLGKNKGSEFNKLSLLPQLLAVYQQILHKLSERQVEWIQIDEPILALDLPVEWQQAYLSAYSQLRQGKSKLLLTTYFGSVTHQLGWLPELAIDGIHLDATASPHDLDKLIAALPAHWQLSLGLINGRNIWRADLDALYSQLSSIKQQRPDFWIGTSCSLLHCPIDLNAETRLDAETKSWFAFARQKCIELHLLQRALREPDDQKILTLKAYSAPLLQRQSSTRVQNQAVQIATAAIRPADAERSTGYAQRVTKQRARLQLPAWPTTTIGSFPQTKEIRELRRQFRQGNIGLAAYEQGIQQEIAYAVREQEQIGLDVLVHGEAERNDMVEYFGEQLDGYAFTQNGWVQSYGSRCVKPPVIVGDISRPATMTVRWSQYAQSLTQKPMKGMLTGPITMLCWSFPREDIAKETMALQLALALRQEVLDLEKAGIAIIQVDEPALREGLPLRQQDQEAYLHWAVNAFKIAVSGVNDDTQIHTHMCYCEFGDIMPAIIALDADVITLETSRSDMELLDVFHHQAYPNDIGPGVYDIHSPNIPDTEWMTRLLQRAQQHIPTERLWVNPDCGLKTRGWPETRAALQNMVKAAQQLRQ
ncbi:5-methyltetrahydropteroyltriglutamate--homocysteine S-methyltransferase [Tolumonas lignilytica]|uniref:5-methyltetrahydropteroyltriglutamate-- homocysteine S-methyltransferase n=1 Tax=Tolumonas lignilytica TaxID=1283284 RepID=UPI000466CCDA|nr:5-methyltetrahydropteroyltriglutamate--homocysteine S-methyltransferase [Tolumonas lignilytica]